MRRASVAELREYVVRATALGPVQLFACWDGEQSFPEKDRLQVPPNALGGDSFEFQQLRMLEFAGEEKLVERRRFAGISFVHPAGTGAASCVSCALIRSARAEDASAATW